MITHDTHDNILIITGVIDSASSTLLANVGPRLTCEVSNTNTILPFSLVCVCM